MPPASAFAVSNPVNEAQLAAELAARMPGTSADASQLVNVSPTTIIWVERGDEVVVHLDSVQVRLLAGSLLVSVDLETDPRKDIGMRREWVAAALSKIAPTFRFSPVLVDPQRIRMPIPNDIHGAWSWDHRSSITDWAEDKVTNTTGDALIPPDPAKAQEGWLRMQPQAAGGSSGSQTQ